MPLEDYAVEPGGRLGLPDVTLLSFDPMNPVGALWSLVWSRRHVDFGEIVLVTRRNLLIHYRDYIQKTGIRLIELEGIPLPRREGYELYHLQHLPEWFKTSHVLYQESDAGVLNPQAWDPAWMYLDYIGAPWPYPMNEPDYPVCDASNCVGNGGFSLRSMKLCEIIMRHWSACALPQRFISDAWIGRTMRPFLETAGMRFGSHRHAERFSAENRIYSGQFGYHGRSTEKINNWSRSALQLL